MNSYDCRNTEEESEEKQKRKERKFTGTRWHLYNVLPLGNIDLSTPHMNIQQTHMHKAASSCFMALRPYRRPGMLTALRVLPTAACDVTASIRRFVSTVPLQAIASVATADSRACINPQPPAPPTAGGSPTNNGRQPCNRTQDKLDALTNDIKKGEVDYSDYFFNVASRKGGWEKRKSQYNLSDDDDMDRCKDCGLKISEHHASTSTVIIPATADDILRAALGHFDFKVPPEANRFRIGSWWVRHGSA